MTARTLFAFSGFGHAGRGHARRDSPRHGGLDLVRAWRVVTTRAELAEASPRMLRDVGLSETDAREEHGRAPWDIAPRYPHRRRPQRPVRGAGADVGWGRWMVDAWRRHRSRQLLAQMDAAGLRDIGVSYADAEAEANKPFWRA